MESSDRRRWRQHFGEARLESLDEAGRRGQKRQLSRGFINRVVAAMMEAPKGTAAPSGAPRQGAPAT